MIKLSGSPRSNHRSFLQCSIHIYIAMASTLSDKNDGRINEIDRRGSEPIFSDGKQQAGFDPQKHRSHLYHAIEGIHRYPNYLQRFQSVEEIDSLEAALEQQLQKVRSQRANIEEQRQRITKAIHVTNEFRRPVTWEEIESIIHKDVARHILPICRRQNLSDVLDGKVDLEYSVSTLTRIMNEEPVNEVFGLPVINSDFCETLVSHVSSKMANVESKQAVINLDWLELNWLNDLLFHVLVRPIARHLYPGMELDWRHGYLARYRPGQRSHLVKHTDDSELTLNIGISDAYEGGAVRFSEFRGEALLDSEYEDYEHDLGKGILHSGRHFHAVTPVTKGERWVWIMWTRSWLGERSAQCPCCWLNNRSAKDRPCICSKVWN